MKLDTILLIDDNRADNRLNERAINKANAANLVLAVQSVPDALVLLQKEEAKSIDLAFLDINMHPMDGWEFLEELNNTPDSEIHKPAIVVLSTSLNPDDSEKALLDSLVTEFLNKPLTQKKMETLLEKYGDTFIKK